MKHIPLLLAGFCALNAGYAVAQSVGEPQPGQNLIPNIEGVNLMGKDGDSYSSYSSTSSTANWNLYQFSIPAYFPSFEGDHSGNEYGSIHYHSGKDVVTRIMPGENPLEQLIANAKAIIDNNHEQSFWVSQNGKDLPCMKTYPSGNTLTDEFDLSMSPPRPTWQPPLSTLKSVVTSGTVKGYGFGVTSTTCALNTWTVLNNVGLWDNVTKQVFYYQIKIGSFGVDGKSNFNVNQKPWWFAKGGPNVQSAKSTITFGYNDYPSTFSDTPMEYQVKKHFSYEILPQLTAAIRAGKAYGMDQNLDNWSITGTSFLTALFGASGGTTVWKDMSLVEQ